MKTIVVSQKGKELSRFVPGGRSTLVGRSPSCDVVMRSKAVRPVHYLVEWVGEGEFNPNEGLWTIVNLAKTSKSERDIGEGLLLSAQPVHDDQFEFKIVEDELAASQLRRGVLSRKIEVMKGEDGITLRSATVAEVIYFRKDIEVVTNVRHFDRRWPTAIVFPNLPQLRFTWPQQSTGLGLIENYGEKSAFQIYNRGLDVTEHLNSKGKKVEIRSSDFFTIETKDYDYYVRLVPPVRVDLVKLAWMKDPTVRAILFLFALIFILGTWMSFRPEEEKKATVEPPRVATVQVVDVKTPEPVVTPPAPVVPPKETVIEEKTTTPESALPTAAKENKASKASAPSIKNTAAKEKKQAGLNAPAPIKDVNSVGLLGRLKGGTHTGEKVSADLIVNKGVVSDTASGKGGFVVSTPPAGELGKGKGGSAKGNNTLAGASSTLKNSGIVDQNSVGAIGMTAGKGKFSAGLQLGGDEASGGARASSVGGEGNMEVAGGLDKEAVRKALAENRRAIRSCYETALLSKKNLEGRLTLRWKISVEGSVDTLVVQASSVGLPSLETCVSRVVKGILFPKAPNKLPTTVIYPFVFQGKR